MVRSGTWLLVSTLVVGSGCTFYEPPAGVLGTTGYACAGPNDAVCDGATPVPQPDAMGVSTFPAIAVGGTFTVTGGTAASLSPARLGDAGGNVIAIAPGVAAVTDMQTIEHVDLLHAVELRVSHESSAGSDHFDEVFGETPFELRRPSDRLRATLVDANGNVLAGDIGYAWSGDNDKVVRVGAPASIVHLELDAAGAVNVSVGTGDLGVVLPFTVSAP
jgi:hypothetical protein